MAIPPTSHLMELHLMAIEQLRYIYTRYSKPEIVYPHHDQPSHVTSYEAGQAAGLCLG